MASQRTTTRSPEPAPGDLRIVQAFVNTVASGDAAERLTSPQALRDWLARQGLVARATELVEADLGRMMAVRRGLRTLLLASKGARLDTAALAELNQAVSPGEEAQADDRSRHVPGSSRDVDPKGHLQPINSIVALLLMIVFLSAEARIVTFMYSA